MKPLSVAAELIARPLPLHEHDLGLLPDGATASGFDIGAAQRLDRSRRVDLRRELHQEFEYYGLGKLEVVGPLR